MLRTDVPLRNHTLSLHNHLLDYFQIIERFMNSSRHKTDALSDLPVGILLRRTTQLLLQTLKIPLKLLHSQQGLFRFLTRSLHSTRAQQTYPQGLRENGDKRMVQPSSRENGDIHRNLSIAVGGRESELDFCKLFYEFEVSTEVLLGDPPELHVDVGLFDALLLPWLLCHDSALDIRFFLAKFVAIQSSTCASDALPAPRSERTR